MQAGRSRSNSASKLLHRSDLQQRRVARHDQHRAVVAQQAVAADLDRVARAELLGLLDELQRPSGPPTPSAPGPPDSRPRPRLPADPRSPQGIQDERHQRPAQRFGQHFRPVRLHPVPFPAARTIARGFVMKEAPFLSRI